MNTMITSRSFRGVLATAVLGAFACSLTAVSTAAAQRSPRASTPVDYS